MRQTRLGLFLLLAPVVLWLGLLIILPHVDVAIESLSERLGPRQYRIGVGNYLEVASEGFYWTTLIRTIIISVLTTLATLVLAFPVALYIAKQAQGRAKGLLLLACLFPFWVSELVRLLGWMMLLRETGLISRLLQTIGIASGPVDMLYNDGAVVLGLVYSGLLFMVVPLVNALESLDLTLIDAGRDLGGSKLTVLRRIVIPHAMPGIVAGSILVFMATLGNYATAVLLGGKSALWFTEQIYLQFITRFNWPLGAALGFILLGCSTLLVWGGLRLSGQRLSTAMRQA